MREIEYRAKRIDNGEWVYGSLINKFDVDAVCVSSSYIIERSAFSISVDSDTTLYDVACLDDYYEVGEATVCQFTGLKDKSGVKIYEGDIIRCKVDMDLIVLVEWSEVMSAFVIREPNKIIRYCDLCFAHNIEVIGNIYDNPELIKESE